MSTSHADDPTPHADAPPPHAGLPFDEYKKKLEERLGELGKQMDTLKELLSKAAHDAKHTLEQQLDKLQKDHAEEFERLAKLRAAGEASLSTLGARLDKLVEDVTAAITTALGMAKPADKHEGDVKAADKPVEEKSAGDK
jgi:hypothetical protein